MNSLYHRIQRIETLQKSIDRQIKLFKAAAGINCLQHCSECCNFTEILATPLEFLPFAWHAFRLGQLDYWFDELEKQSSDPHCVFHQKTADCWGCQIYPARGLICRLFGFSAGTDKNGNPVYGACRVLKAQKPDLINRVREQMGNGVRIPILAHQYRKLAAIDPVAGNEFVPINQAIKKALEIIYFHFEYRECA